jgi:hypothetical protein
MAPHTRDQEWYSLAERASKETDPVKLTTLVSELCNALDARLKPSSRAARRTCQGNRSTRSTHFDERLNSNCAPTEG